MGPTRPLLGLPSSLWWLGLTMNIVLFWGLGKNSLWCIWTRVALASGNKGAAPTSHSQVWLAGRNFSHFIQPLWSLFLAVALTPAHGRCSRSTFFALLFPRQEAAVPMAGLRHLGLSTHLQPQLQPGPAEQHRPMPRDSHGVAQEGLAG